MQVTSYWLQVGTCIINSMLLRYTHLDNRHNLRRQVSLKI